jgi:hypothetical protein
MLHISLSQRAACTGNMTSADLKTTFIRVSHDAKASICTRAGLHLTHVHEHPKILEKILIQENSVTRYTNAFEKRYYGYCEPLDFFHPATYLHVLRDVWVVGSEAHIFFEPDLFLTQRNSGTKDPQTDTTLCQSDRRTGLYSCQPRARQ